MIVAKLEACKLELRKFIKLTKKYYIETGFFHDALTCKRILTCIDLKETQEKVTVNPDAQFSCCAETCDLLLRHCKYCNSLIQYFVISCYYYSVR